MWCNDQGVSPFLEWFARLPEKAQDKCLVRIERLKELGYELRRPEADYLDEDIYELRVKCQAINYRVLYFFAGKQLVVVSHGLSKQEAQVPKREMQAAIDRRERFLADPERHTYRE
jgi:phage-related protein